MTDLDEEEIGDEYPRAFIERIRHCPYCDATFDLTTVKDIQNARIEHIKQEHPEKRPFVIG